MTGLLLNLRPYEKFLVGEVAIQNGSRRGQLRFSNSAAGVLRVGDALHPDDVVSPLTRAYYAAQMLLLSGDEGQADHSELISLLHDAKKGYSEFYLEANIETALEAAQDGRLYNVLRALKPVLPTEAVILASLGVEGGVNQFATKDRVA